MIGKIKVEFDLERNTSIFATVDDKPLHDIFRIDSITVNLSETEIPKVNIGVLISGVEISAYGQLKINGISIPKGLEEEVLEQMRETLAEYYSESNGYAPEDNNNDGYID